MGSTALQLGSSFMPQPSVRWPVQPSARFSVRLFSLVSSWLLLPGSQSCLTSSKLQFLLSTFLPTLSSPAFPRGLWGQSPTPSTALDTAQTTHHTQRQGCTWSQIQSHKGPTSPRHRCRVSQNRSTYTQCWSWGPSSIPDTADGSPPVGYRFSPGARQGKRCLRQIWNGMECRGLGCSSALGR